MILGRTLAQWLSDILSGISVLMLGTYLGLWASRAVFRSDRGDGERRRRLRTTAWRFAVPLLAVGLLVLARMPIWNAVSAHIPFTKPHTEATLTAQWQNRVAFTEIVSAQPGDQVALDFRYCNQGVGTAHNVTIRVDLSPGLTTSSEGCLLRTSADSQGFPLWDYERGRYYPDRVPGIFKDGRNIGSYLGGAWAQVLFQVKVSQRPPAWWGPSHTYHNVVVWVSCDECRDCAGKDGSITAYIHVPYKNVRAKVRE